MQKQASSSLKWTFAITAAGLFMFALDRQVVGTALPSIRHDLGTSLQTLEWTVSAYTLSFSVLLLVGGRVLGAWAAVAAGASSLGPVVGGALTQALSWHWIFWLNVPVGIALIPLARGRLDETHGPRRPLDLTGIALSATGLLAPVWSLIEAGRLGWRNPQILLALGARGSASWPSPASATRTSSQRSRLRASPARACSRRFKLRCSAPWRPRSKARHPTSRL